MSFGYINVILLITLTYILNLTGILYTRITIIKIHTFRTNRIYASHTVITIITTLFTVLSACFANTVFEKLIKLAINKTYIVRAVDALAG